MEGRLQNFVEERLPIFFPRRHERTVLTCVNPECFGGLVDATIEHGGRAVVERVRDGARRIDPFEAEFFERQPRGKTARRRPSGGPPNNNRGGIRAR